MKCVLCHNIIKGYGNNSQPIKNGLCCDTCNSIKVIPIRLSRLEKLKEKRDGK